MSNAASFVDVKAAEDHLMRFLSVDGVTGEDRGRWRNRVKGELTWAADEGRRDHLGERPEECGRALHTTSSQRHPSDDLLSRYARLAGPAAAARDA